MLAERGRSVEILLLDLIVLSYSFRSFSVLLVILGGNKGDKRRSPHPASASNVCVTHLLLPGIGSSKQSDFFSHIMEESSSHHDDHGERAVLMPRLLASTQHTYSRSITNTPGHEEAAREDRYADIQPPPPRSGPFQDKNESNYFKRIDWSPDGTSVLTSSADNKLRLFVAPPDLLEPGESRRLTPYTTYAAAEPTYAQVFYPGYNLSDPSTTLVLTSPRDLPIQLINVLDPSPKPIGTYSLVCPTTEKYQTPSSLLFYPSGNVFYTGTECLIALFDISRPGEGPTTRLPTIPSKRHKMKGGGVGMRGIVSCLALQPESGAAGAGSSMLAAGAWTRWVSLYDGEGMGGTVANWSVASAADTEASISGAGISQVLWSACGRYLYVVERKSKGVLVYDVRVTGKLVAWLEGRDADTNQRMAVDIRTVNGTNEVWTGGTNGTVKSWHEVGSKEGAHVFDDSWQAYGEDTVVGGVSMHSCGSIIATASGSRRELDISFDDSDSDDETSDGEEESHGRPSAITRNTKSSHAVSEDNSVKIWSFA